jgi:hypothetical protein
VIRIWVERDSWPSLKARITSTLDVATEEEVTTGATSIEQIETIVRGWLESYVRTAGIDE